MDNVASAHVDPVAYAPTRQLTLTLAGAAALAGALAIPVGNPGRLLMIVLALALAAEALRCTVIRPVLRADTDRVRIRIRTGEHDYGWSEVASVRARSTRRLVTVNLVEIDLGETLIVIPAYRLGRPAADVVAELSALRARPYR